MLNDVYCVTQARDMGDMRIGFITDTFFSMALKC